MDFIMMFDRQYINEGIICINSILSNSTQSNIFVLCLESEVEKKLNNIKRVITIKREDFEKANLKISATRPAKPWAPYTQSLKPFLPNYIFDLYDVEVLTYVDSDMLFWGRTEEIEKAMGGYSFMVTSREINPPPPTGYFNGGFFSCRNNQCSREFLKWWGERCIEWCLWEAGPDGKFGEEGYLNIFKTNPEKFQNIRICRHPGINLAPWNIHKHKIKQMGNGFMIDDNFPLICFHYQGFNKETFKIQNTWSPEIIEIYQTYYNKIGV